MDFYCLEILIQNISVFGNTYAHSQKNCKIPHQQSLIHKNLNFITLLKKNKNCQKEK